MPKNFSPNSHDITEKQRWQAFTMVLAAGFMTLLDVSIVNVALPSIENATHAGTTEIQWIVAGYSLIFGLALVPAGRLGDAYGRRRMFLIGLTGFVLASLGCGLSTSAQMLVIMRLVQGAFAGVLSPQVAAIIQELFSGVARARAFGLFGMTVGLSTAVGPLLGGALVSALGAEHGWRFVFLINVPIGLVVFPLALKLLPPLHPQSQERFSLDALGLALIAGAVLSLMWPFITGTSGSGGLAAAPWWLIGVAVACTLALVAWERHRDSKGRSAVLPGDLVHDRSFVLGASLGAVYFAGFTGVFIVITMFYQQGMNTPAVVAGLAQTPWALASAIASARAGRHVVVKGRAVVVRGLSMMMLALLALAAVVWALPAHIAAWVMPALFVLAGWGGGSVISPNQALALENVPRTLAGTASGLLQTLQRLGAAVGMALITTLFYTIVGKHQDYALALALSFCFAACAVFLALLIALADQRRRGPVVEGRE